MVALHTTAGVPGGSQGRAYNKELLGGPLTELVMIVRIAFGAGWLNHGDHRAADAGRQRLRAAGKCHRLC